MRFLLDTSVCVQFLRAHESTMRHLHAAGPEGVALSAMTVAELRFGTLKAGNPPAAQAQLDELLAATDIIAFDSKAAEHHAHCRRALDLAGTPIGEGGLIIASTALANELVVATMNIWDFWRVPGLTVHDWTD